MLPALSAKLLRMIQYLCDSLNYSLIYIIVIIFGAAIASGGRSLWISIISIFIFVIACDEILPDFHGESNNLKFWYTDIQLLLSLPLILMITFIALNAVGPKPVLVIDFVMRCVGFDTDLSRNQSDPLIIFMLVGTIYGAFGITIAHELCHRTDSIISQIFARWLLAFSFDTGFAIDHIYGHHRYVGNPSDPVTAQRGETIFSYLLRSIIGQAIRGLDIKYAFG